MYTAYIGHRLINLYNTHRRVAPPLSPRAFFDEVFFPLFFDDNKYLIKGGNSTFGQLVNNEKKLRKEVQENGQVWEDEHPKFRKEALDGFHEKVDDLKEPLMHLFLGGIASKVTASTSGQVSTITSGVSKDEVYCSWIGSATAIGVSSGLTLAIDSDEVLLAIFDGWHLYRQYISETPILVGNQIETWNGWFISHRFSENYDENDPLRDFQPQMKKTGKNIRFNTIDWVQVLFALASQLPKRTLTAYIFSLGDMNKTVGFRQLRLPEVHNFVDLYLHLFGRNDGVPNSSALAKLYRSELGFRLACMQGVIGLQAIKPAKLESYLQKHGGVKKTWKLPKNDSQSFTFHLYLTWIYAMLDNKYLIDLAEKTAAALRHYGASDTKGRTTAMRQAEQVLKASGRRAFIEQLTGVVQQNRKHAPLFDKLVDAIVTMPNSDFPLLLTLIRFKYHTQN